MLLDAVEVLTVGRAQVVVFDALTLGFETGVGGAVATNVNVSADDWVTVMVCVGREVVAAVGGAGTTKVSAGLAGARSLGAAVALAVTIGLSVRAALEPK